MPFVRVHDEQVGVCACVFLFCCKEGVRDGWDGSTVDNGCRSTQFNSIPRSEKEKRAGASLPSVVLDHVSQLDDELSFFVLLTALERVLLVERQKAEANFSWKFDFYYLNKTDI